MDSFGGDEEFVGDLLGCATLSDQLAHVQFAGSQPGQITLEIIDFLPEYALHADTDLIDEVLLVSNEEAIETARRVAVLDGIPAGISSGAAGGALVNR